MSATVSAFLYNKTRQTLAMIVIKIHLDQVGTMEVILQKKRQKLNIFSAACKVLFSPFLIPRSAAAPTSLQNAFLTRNFKPQPASLLPLNWEALQLERSWDFVPTGQTPPPRSGGNVQNQNRYESLSDVESRVWFASKNLTPCRMH